MTKEEDLRLAALVERVSARLRPVCSQWPEELFEEMVQHLAYITLKYDAEPTSTYDRRSTERLLADMRALLERSKTVRSR